MVNDDLPTTAKPRKYRILTNNQSNGTPTITSRLPSLLSKSSVFPSTSETVHVKRYRSPQKDVLTASSASKIERQTTTIITQTRLPVINDHEHKRKSDFQRRQIYALNHLMRELEQEQFRQLNGIGTVNTEEILSNNEDSTQQSP